MLVTAQTPQHGTPSPELAEKAFEGLLRDRGVDKATFQRYSDAVAADPKRRDRIRRMILMRADELRFTTARAREVPAKEPPSP
jgi:hypothetical protein